MARDLAELPKAHLHIHLEGGMRPATLAELADKYGMTVPTIRGFGSFTVFAAMYVAVCEVLRTHDDLRRLVSEVVDDAAAHGAHWIEPASYLSHHRARLGPEEEVLEVILDELASASARNGIDAGFIVAGDRTRDVDDCVAQARLAARYAGRGVVGLGLANDEVGHPPEPFAPAFDIADDAGLLCVPHGGELEGPAWITGALDALHANRIQHGVRAVEEPDVVRRLADSDVCLDVCPTSNLMLAVFPSLAEHPLPALLDAGVRCSINGDDPLLFGPNLLEEYELCRRDFGFDDARMAHIARCSIEASGAPAGTKRTALTGIDTWLASD